MPVSRTVCGGRLVVEIGEIWAVVKSRKPFSLALMILTCTVSPTPIMTGLPCVSPKN